MVVTAFMLAAGALAGYLVGPWQAVTAARGPWWTPLAWYLSVGPVRFVAWVLASGWVESAFNRDAVGDAGLAVGVLQYHDGSVLPVDLEARRSPFWSGYFATEYTITAQQGRPWWPFVLRTPVLGYLAFRWSWRSGEPATLVGVRALSRETRWAREATASAAVAVVLTVLVCIGMRIRWKP